jgi:hypothetical protein
MRAGGALAVAGVLGTDTGAVSGRRRMTSELISLAIALGGIGAIAFKLKLSLDIIRLEAAARVRRQEGIRS